MHTETLIASVYQRRPLWDKSDRMYHNRDAARDLWSEVCGELGLDKSAIESVKKRWNSLRDVFRREFHKVNKSEEGEVTVPTWSYYQSMTFLCSQMKPKSNTTNLEVTDHEILLNNYDEDSKYDASNLISLKNFKRKQSEELDPYEELESKKRQSVNFLETDDSDYHFLMSLLPFLKAVPYHRKLAVRMRLQQILTEEYSRNKNQTYCDAIPMENVSIMQSPHQLDDER